MKSLFDVLVEPVVTEKAFQATNNNNVYAFKVSKNATKSQISKAIAKAFGVKVLTVNTLNNEGKRKNFKRQEGKRSDWKKAYVKIEKGQTIKLHEQV